MIWNFPIDPVPMRYSCDWHKWFNLYFDKNKIEHKTVLADSLSDKIENGRFLDCVNTNYYKSLQINNFIKQINEGKIKTGDVLFFQDAWFPGIEMIKYISDVMNLGLHFYGCLHAGSYDPNDHLYEVGMGNWAVHFEHALFSIFDGLFVATKYHKNLILKSRSIPPDKIHVTGFPFYSKLDGVYSKDRIVLFPHRLDKEKNPDLFDSIGKNVNRELKKRGIRDWKFIKSMEFCQTKEEYYNLLKKSIFAISLAEQETWGIAMQECLDYGCIPFVPNRLSYPEIFSPRFLYQDIFEMTNKLIKMIKDYEHYTIVPHLSGVYSLKKYLKENIWGNVSITRMVRIMTGVG